MRWAKEDVEIGGHLIERGQRVLVSLSGANRDSAVFADPDVLDIDRDPNPRVAFAHGIHVCIGANLARLEAQEAFAGLTSRLPVPGLEIDEAECFPTVVGRSIKRLPVRFQWRDDDGRAYRIRVDHDRCVGSTLCRHFAAGVFALDDNGQSIVADADAAGAEAILEAAEQCPQAAIVLEDAGTGQRVFP